MRRGLGQSPREQTVKVEQKSLCLASRSKKLGG
jgi:hypothetical protein